MADSKLSALTGAGAFNDADLLYIVQGGVSYKTTWGAIKAAILLAKYPEVANFAALPAAAAHNGETYVVLAAQGTYFINRKPSGFYYSNGATWTYVGDLPENYFTDSILQISDDADPTKIVKFQLSSLTTGTTRTLTAPDASGTIMLVGDAPAAHAPTHKAGGSDPIKLDEFAAPTDITSLNADTNKHGLLPKLAGGTVSFLRADGNYAQPLGTNPGFSAAGGSSTFQTLGFSDGNGVSFTNTNGSVGATVRTDYASSNHSHGNPTLALTNLSGTTASASNGLTISLSASQSNQAFSAAGGSSAFQTLGFSDGNGVSFTNTNGSVGATVRTDYASSNHSHGNPTLALTNLSGTTASASNGLTISLSASQSNQAFSAAGGSSAFQTLGFSDGNGVSFTNTNGSVGATVRTDYASSNHSHGNPTLALTNLSGTTASASNGLTISLSASQSNQAFSAAGGSSAFQTLGFSDGNGVSFTNTNGSVGATVRTDYASSNHSHGNPTLALTNLSGTTASASNGLTLSLSAALQSNQTLGLYALGNTTQSSSGAVDARSLSFVGGGNISVGVTGNSVVISQTGGGGGGLTNINLSAGTTSNNLSAFTLSNSNNVAFGLAASTVTASAFVNVSAGTTSANVSAWTYSNSNNVSFGLNGGTLTASYGLSVNAGTTTNNLSFLEFDNSNGVSFGLNAGTITASVVPPVTLSSYDPMPIWGRSTQTAPAFQGTSGFAKFVPFEVNNYVSAGIMDVPVSMSFVTNGTSSGNQSCGIGFGIYSRGTGASSTRLESVAMASFSFGVTGNNSTYSINQITTTAYSGYGAASLITSAGSAISSMYTGNRRIAFPINALLTPGQYWIGTIGTSSSSSVSVGIGMSLYLASVGFQGFGFQPPGSSTFGVFTENNNVSGLWYGVAQGSWSSAGSVQNLPVSAPLSQISANGGQGNPFFKFWRT